MNAPRKNLDIIGGVEIWDFSPDDFLGEASKDCWDYWHNRRGGNQAALEKDIDLLDLAHHLPCLAVLEWVDTKLLIKFCGTRIAGSFDNDPTGLYLDEIPNSEISMNRHVRSRDQVLPFVIHSPFYLARKDFQDYESLNLPLLDEHHKVCGSLVCFTFLTRADMQR